MKSALRCCDCVSLVDHINGTRIDIRSVVVD